jgi:hypothetical protein
MRECVPPRRYALRADPSPTSYWVEASNARLLETSEDILCLNKRNFGQNAFLLIADPPVLHMAALAEQQGPALGAGEPAAAAAVAGTQLTDGGVGHTRSALASRNAVVRLGIAYGAGPRSGRSASPHLGGADAASVAPKSAATLAETTARKEAIEPQLITAASPSPDRATEVRAGAETTARKEASEPQLITAASPSPDRVTEVRAGAERALTKR